MAVEDLIAVPEQPACDSCQHWDARAGLVKEVSHDLGIGGIWDVCQLVQRRMYAWQDAGIF